MKLSTLLRETIRNTVTGTSRFVLNTILLGAVVTALALVDQMSITRLLAEAEAFRSSGAATEVLVAEDRVDGPACEALADAPGVAHAGAVKASASRVTVAALPEAPVPLYEVSPGFAAILTGADVSSRGVLIPDDLAQSLGASAGAQVTTDSGPMTIASVYGYPSDGRRPGFGYAILSPTQASRTFDECWVTAWPQVPNLRSLLLTAVLTADKASSTKPSVIQLNSSLGGSFDGFASFRERLTRAATPSSFVVAIGLGFVSVRMRRLELTSALHAGVAKSDLLALNLLEASAWAGAAGALAVGVVSAAAWAGSHGDQSAVFESTVGVPLAGVAGALLGVVIASSSISERRLLRYFKDR
ncbi:hypothetical protein [uncultured Leifsonia sp.]|uniref:hypothetical protein n=1 Tax=uncultured Leifsonia sp. TaxID=340359 RepID=UPI0025CFB71B|nr:hypothetical protein [uncultured Leifsonia sp.]